MKKTDVVIAGSGCSGLYCALQLPRDKKILMITKSQAENSDSFLAQGGMCMLKNEEDYESYFEDTLRAGHYENDKKSVEIMIRSSQDVVSDLEEYGACFQKDEQGNLMFTREGAHSQKRILFHEDVTGKEITSKLLEQVRKLPNVTIVENTTMLDIIRHDDQCCGMFAKRAAKAIGSSYFCGNETITEAAAGTVNLQDYKDVENLEKSYQKQVKDEIERVNNRKEIG